MKKLKWLLIIASLLLLLSGGIMANFFPSPPKIWEKVDSYVLLIQDMDRTNKQTMVDEYYVDGKLYLTFRLLRQCEDGKWRYDKWPSFYMYDISGDGILSVEMGEIINDSAHDGWNDNETVVRPQNESNL